MVLKYYAAVLLKLKFTSDVNAEGVNIEKQCVVCFFKFLFRAHSYRKY